MPKPGSSWRGRRRKRRLARRGSSAASWRRQPNILERFAAELAQSGVAGEVRTAKLLYLAVTSRLLERPVSIALKGPSSGGKSYLVERVLSLLPGERLLRPHRHERDGRWPTPRSPSTPLPGHLRGSRHERGLRRPTSCARCSPRAASATRLVEKTSEGMKPRLIEREGPTGLIVTTTAVKLHPENETRLLSLTVTDTQDQTRAVMAALAEEAGEAGPNVEPWHALQVWLEGAEHRVWIPYAKILAELIPPVAVRLRRDFGALLNLIRAHALLHQATRERDAEGRIVATIEEDYAAVRELVVRPRLRA